MQKRYVKTTRPAEHGLGDETVTVPQYDYMSPEDTALYDAALAGALTREEANEAVCRLLLEVREYAMYTASRY